MITKKDYINLIAASRESLPDDKALKFSTMYPKWAVGKTVYTGDRYQYEGVLYKCLQSHDTQETWTPTDAPSLWAKVLIPDPEVIPEWEQPESTNPYMTGDKVTHDGKTWESLVDNNVWEPGATGTEGVWAEITA